MLTPFTDEYNKRYRAVIEPAIKRAGFSPLRADEIYSPGIIHHDIMREIQSADVIVADVTDRNPNVNYELGVAHAFKKEVIIISQRIEDVPFDYRHFRVIQYKTKGTGSETKLQGDLLRALKTISTDAGSEHASAPDIIHVFHDRGQVNLLQILESAESGTEINIMGTALNDITNAGMRAPIKFKLEQGCKFRILSMDDNSKFCEQRSLEERDLPLKEWQTNLRIQNEALLTLKKLTDDLHLQKNLAFSRYDAPPSLYLFMTSKRMIVGFYLRHKFGASSPHIEISINSYLASAFLEHFNAVWQDSVESVGIF